MTGKRTNRVLVTSSLMVGMFLAAIEATIVATAMPTIVSTLGGFELYSWVFSAFLLANGAFIPVFGKLADIYGRKKVFVIATGIFLAGALLCALARTMEQLIIFRALQGIGAAGIMPITQTIVGDIYSLQERAKIQGLFGSVWGVSSILGPVAGGIIVDSFSWQWIFYLNIPLGLMAIFGVVLFLQEKTEKRKKPIDFAGSFLLIIFISSLLVFLIQGGTAWNWLSPKSALFLGAAVCGGAAFFWREMKAPDPLLPIELFRNRIVFSCDLAVVFSGALTLGLSSYIPPFAQGVLGTSATVAGLTLGAMSISWSLAGTLSPGIFMRRGYRATVAIASLFAVLSTLVLLFINRHTHPLFIGFATFLMGIGMGLSSTTFLVAVQEAVGWEQRGTATGSNAFMRMIGSTIGVAVFGNILNHNLVQRMMTLPSEVKAMFPAGDLDVTSLLMEAASRNSLSVKALDSLVKDFSASLHMVFLALLITALIGVLAVFFIPRGLPGQLNNNSGD